MKLKSLNTLRSTTDDPDQMVNLPSDYVRIKSRTQRKFVFPKINIRTSANINKSQHLRRVLRVKELKCHEDFGLEAFCVMICCLWEIKVLHYSVFVIRKHKFGGMVHLRVGSGSLMKVL